MLILDKTLLSPDSPEAKNDFNAFCMVDKKDISLFINACEAAGYDGVALSEWQPADKSYRISLKLDTECTTAAEALLVELANRNLDIPVNPISAKGLGVLNSAEAKVMRKFGRHGQTLALV